MSVSGFLSSIADKAQNAINQTPLAGHSHAGDATANHAASQSGYRSALGSLQHQIRTIGQQYTSTTPIQRIITLEKGVALDFDALGRDGKGQSKELYTWGQGEDPDLTDVTDRLAFLNFVHGSLATSLAATLDGARVPLKSLRDAEAAIAPKRNILTGLYNQIARIEHSQEKGTERRLAELKEQLSRAESFAEQSEKELELLKRKAIRESEKKKWEAIQEYAEKLVLVSQAVKPIIEALPTLPPTDANAYKGAQVTAAARASVQHALDNYKPGRLTLDLQIGGDLSRSDTRSFGESHASELAVPATEHDSHPGLPVTPPIPEHPTGEEGHGVPPPTNLPGNSDQSATLIPALPVSAVVQDTSPSVAGKLAESHPEDLYSTSPVKTENLVEERKQPAQPEETVRVPAAGSESAEDEKKRLEKEERERVLAGGASTSSTRNVAGKDGDELPPYQEIEE